MKSVVGISVCVVTLIFSACTNPTSSTPGTIVGTWILSTIQGVSASLVGASLLGLFFAKLGGSGSRLPSP